jgi:disulfide bond formation protein DsbB
MVPGAPEKALARAQGPEQTGPPDQEVRITTATMSSFFALLALAADAAVAAGIVLWVGGKFSGSVARLGAAAAAALREYALWFAWAVAAVAMLGSLYYSEIANFEPCRWCWYQRIAMYPLAVILGIAAFGRDLRIRRYAFPLALGGGLVAAYHYSIQLFPSFESGSCSISVPCASPYVWKFDFVSIPFMAMSAFALILLLLAVAGSPGRGDNNE